MSELNIYSKEQTDNLLAGKQSNLTFDTTPVAGSTNPVTSGGIKTAIDVKQDTLVAGTGITITGNTISASGASVITAHMYSTWGDLVSDIIAHSVNGRPNCILKCTYDAFTELKIVSIQSNSITFEVSYILFLGGGNFIIGRDAGPNTVQSNNTSNVFSFETAEVTVNKETGTSAPNLIMTDETNETLSLGTGDVILYY